MELQWIDNGDPNTQLRNTFIRSHAAKVGRRRLREVNLRGEFSHVHLVIYTADVLSVRDPDE